MHRIYVRNKIVHAILHRQAPFPWLPYILAPIYSPCISTFCPDLLTLHLTALVAASPCPKAGKPDVQSSIPVHACQCQMLRECKYIYAGVSYLLIVCWLATERAPRYLVSAPPRYCRPPLSPAVRKGGGCVVSPLLVIVIRLAFYSVRSIAVLRCLGLLSDSLFFPLLLAVLPACLRAIQPNPSSACFILLIHWLWFSSDVMQRSCFIYSIYADAISVADRHAIPHSLTSHPLPLCPSLLPVQTCSEVFHSVVRRRVGFILCCSFFINQPSHKHCL